MAKISARGARELGRWKKGEATLVLTSDGRILVKYLAGDGYKIWGKLKATVEDKLGAADRIAAKLGYVKVATR